MGSYSLDLRERVVKAHLEEGQNKSAVARRFGVSRWTVERYVKRSATGSLAPTPHPGSKQRLDAAGCELLRAQVAAQHDWTLEQHAAALTAATGVALKKSSVGNYPKRLGITRTRGTSPALVGVLSKKRALSPPNKTKQQERATGPR